jgi:hypothetical protein
MGWAGNVPAAAPATTETAAFPPDLESYGDSQVDGIAAILAHRVRQEPFNLAATLILVCRSLKNTSTTRCHRRPSWAGR